MPRAAWRRATLTLVVYVHPAVFVAVVVFAAYDKWQMWREQHAWRALRASPSEVVRAVGRRPRSVYAARR
jgi:hypothetical protein